MVYMDEEGINIDVHYRTYMLTNNFLRIVFNEREDKFLLSKKIKKLVIPKVNIANMPTKF